MAADVPDCIAPCLGLVQVGEREAAEREPSIGRVMMRKAGSFTTALGMSGPEKHEAWSTASDDASAHDGIADAPWRCFIGQGRSGIEERYTMNQGPCNGGLVWRRSRVLVFHGLKHSGTRPRALYRVHGRAAPARLHCCW